MRLTKSVLLAVNGRLAAGLLLPPPHGPYNVSMQTKELTDHSRPDPWNSSHPRRLMVSRFDPIIPSKCTACIVPYMTPLIAASEDEILSFFMSTANLTWPTGVLGQLELQVCCTCSSANSHFKRGAYPVVLLGAGLNTTRLFYSVLAQEIASRGYTVITLDHPYETDIVEFPDGTVIYGGKVVGHQNETAQYVRALDIRTNDASFVLTQLGVPFVTDTDDPARAKAGYVGHSFGGAAAAAAMLNDTRVVGGANLDGTMFGPVPNAGIGRPGIRQSFLLWGSEGHDSSVDESWGRFLETVGRWDPGEWVRELSLQGSTHGGFWDAGVIADVAGWRGIGEMGGLVELFCGLSPVGSRVMKILGVYLGAFLGMTLEGEGEGLLVGPSEEFPEVLFL
ncbi:Platelet-activating factor acetylhydrolase [Coniochaeta hoffmannii]|uniref:1-alkyl-2-acetylglycerophosphocholine esterase n=1 Tax=Coniochaeta hoffmannii TaxID=91930 RepID=A0AA38S8Y0_9PEZI|nr:Platelet-activating factor acetylhydrolase [Coniochaeta hoffmannii]